MKYEKYLLLAAITFFSSTASAYKILALFPHVAKSHSAMQEALMKGLAARGHEVFVVSHFPQDHSVPDYTDISLVGSMKVAVEDTPLDNVGTGDVMMNANMLADMAVETCEKTLSFPPIQKLIESEEKFDLIITELFNTDCMLGFVHKFKVPFIAIGTSVMMPWGNARFGNPDNPSYIPHHFLPHSDRMSFSERLLNAVCQVSVQWAYHFLMDTPTERIARRYFGDSLPPLADIARNTSLLLLNTHFSMNQPRPLVPQIIEVGGLHLPLPKPLPEVLSWSILYKY
jgi:glucuronosyltransferase